MATPPLRADELLVLPVRLHGIQLGRPVDVLLDREELKALGLDVLCGDEIHRFLPWPTAVVTGKGIAIASPFVLLEEDELAFYRARAVGLASLRGRAVERNGRKLGALVDIAIAADGSLVDVVVETNDGKQTHPFRSDLRFAPGSRFAA
jgi:hypothetical protein